MRYSEAIRRGYAGQAHARSAHGWRFCDIRTLFAEVVGADANRSENVNAAAAEERTRMGPAPFPPWIVIAHRTVLMSAEHSRVVSLAKFREAARLDRSRDASGSQSGSQAADAASAQSA